MKHTDAIEIVNQFQLTINITISYFYCLVMIIMVIRLSYICMISIIIM